MSSFDALLNATALISGEAALPPDAAPSRVFEPVPGDAHERRETAMRDDYRQDSLSGQQSERLDRTGVGARKAAALDARSLAARAENTSATTPARDASAAPKQATDRPAPPGGGVARALSLSTDRAGDGTTARNGGANAGRSPAGVNPAPSQVAPSIPASGAAGAASAANVRGDGSSGGVAHEVARALTAVRSGAEVAKAAGGSQGGAPAGGDAKPSQAPQSRGTASTSRGGEEASRSSRQTSESATTERTEFDRLIKSMRLRLGEHRSSARLRLDPPELGRMSVDVRMNGRDVRIEVRTETEDARRMLQQRAGQLREALQQHGIHVDRFEVTGDLAGRDVQDGRSGQQLSLSHDGGQRRGEAPQRRTISDIRSLETPEAFESAEPPELATVGERRIDVRV